MEEQPLSGDELERAARSSYRYYVESVVHNRQDNRESHALDMLTRHVIAEKGNTEKALQKFRNTLEWRKEMKVDEMRVCFDKDVVEDENDEEAAKLRAMLKRANGRTDSPLREFVYGYDKDGRALYHVITKHSLRKIESARVFIQSHVYHLERAIACTERKTNGRIQKATIFVDLSDFEMWMSPGMSVNRKALDLMASHYPERLNRVFLMDGPMSFRLLWNLLYPFLDPVTKDKFHVIFGPSQKESHVLVDVDADQALPHMLPDGMGKLDGVTTIDAKNFYYETPFDHAYREDTAGEGRT